MTTDCWAWGSAVQRSAENIRLEHSRGLRCNIIANKLVVDISWLIYNGYIPVVKVDIGFGLNLMSSFFSQITRNITSTRHQDISVIQLCCIQAIGIDGI
jgi:hypothetical protein